MKEIEVKAKLTDKDTVMQKLTALGCVFQDSITQNDFVYVKNIGTPEIYNDNDVFLRIRIKNKSKILFTLKKPLSNDLDALEYETEVSSKEEMEQALLLMGYQEALRINKTRITTSYNGWELCLDEVEELGSFIEIEKLADEEEDSLKIQQDLFDFLLTLGVKSEDRTMFGYDTLILNKK